MVLVTEEAETYMCLFCGESIVRSDVDPCSAVFTAGWADDAFDSGTGQYWLHARCLRERASSSVPLYFLDAIQDT